MKVAIIAFYTMDSTIPLAKHISEAGVDVDLYSLLRQGNQNAYIYDFSSNKQPNGFVNPKVVKESLGEKLYNYLSPVNLNIFIYPNKGGRIKRSIFLDFYYAYKLARQIKRKKYDLIHVIHVDDRFWNYIYFFLKNKTIVQTLHEVTSHEETTSRNRIRLLTTLIKKSIPIIFNSNISKQRFIDFRKLISGKNTSEENLVMIRFGLYETYKCISCCPARTNSSGKISLLNFGRILPYKGIHYLIEAVSILQNKYPIHLVIAGSGKPYFDFKGIRSFEFINRNVLNEEIVELIKDCDIVVLPYTSASQSGIPMTVYLFNKPIVATNLDGLKEVVKHLKTGILVDHLNAQTLASAIEMLLENKRLLFNIKKNIENEYKEGEFSWPFIAKQTVEFYRLQIKQRKLRKRFLIKVNKRSAGT